MPAQLKASQDEASWLANTTVGTIPQLGMLIICERDAAVQRVLHQQQFATPHIHVLLSTSACIPAPGCQPFPGRLQASGFRLLLWEDQLVCILDRSNHQCQADLYLLGMLLDGG